MDMSKKIELIGRLYMVRNDIERGLNKTTNAYGPKFFLEYPGRDLTGTEKATLKAIKEQEFDLQAAMDGITAIMDDLCDII